MEEKYISNIIPKTYCQQGLQSIRNRDNLFEILLHHQKLPKEGYDEQTIEYFIQRFSLMDSNNFSGKSGVGEREGRVISSIVSKRHFHLAHGIGRSGDILEVQPKAAGSSIIYKLTNKLTAHALEIAGLQSISNVTVFPMATGMTIALTLLAIKSLHPTRTKVIWSRIDQKSCFKATLLAGLTPLIVEPKLIPSSSSTASSTPSSTTSYELVTDLEEIKRLLTADRESANPEILAVISTTSCFAPRQPDDVENLAILCRDFDCLHLINNAYGL
jgi:O-phospho-L-seryl-tRNASec:L-selenocysteinyl-tRNA synthase